MNLINKFKKKKSNDYEKKNIYDKYLRKKSNKIYVN